MSRMRSEVCIKTRTKKVVILRHGSNCVRCCGHRGDGLPDGGVCSVVSSKCKKL